MQVSITKPKHTIVIDVLHILMLTDIIENEFFLSAFPLDFSSPNSQFSFEWNFEILYDGRVPRHNCLPCVLIILYNIIYFMNVDTYKNIC